MSLRRKIASFSIGFFSILLCFCTVLFWYAVKPSQHSGDVPIVIDCPGNYRDVLGILEHHKIIDDNRVLWLNLLKLCRVFDIRVKFGEFSVPARVSFIDALKIINLGKSVVRKITIPEGFSSLQIVERLNKNKHLLGEIESPISEGMLLPDTYCFKYPATKQSIIDAAKSAMQKFLDAEWKRRSELCPVKTPYEALILASIVEKETAHEREEVAGLYANRLRIKMRLQADPTVVYALKRGGKLGRNLLHKDLKIDDKYNTYRNVGLPPTPIAHPGRASILAVLHPKQSEYLFFVYDPSISRNVFSKTFAEHVRNRTRIKKQKAT